MVSTAARVGSINVLLQTELGPGVAGLNKFASAVESTGARTSRTVSSIDRSVLSLNSTLSRLDNKAFTRLSLSALNASKGVERLKGALLAASALGGGIGGAFALKGAIEYSDTYKTVGNRLRVVVGEAGALRDTEKQIFDVAQRSRASYEATGILFSRMANASKRLGISQSDVLRTTETIQKAMLIGGATPVEAAQSSIQLSQGLASNRLQGDELRSVLENPALGQLLADNITKGDIGKLREIASAGQLTAGVVIKAFRDASGAIDGLFAKTEQTIGQAFVQIDNALMRYIGTSGAANASSRATVALLNAVAENFEGIADTLVKIGVLVAAAYGGRSLQALKSWAGGVRLARLEAVNAAAAELQRANAEKIATAQTLANTRAQYEMSKAGSITQATRLRFGRELQAATNADFQATKRQSAALVQHDAALRASSVSGMALASAGRAASAAWSFIGGPFGAALIAIGVGMYVTSKNAAEAQERSDYYSEAIKKAGEESRGAAGGIEAAAKAYFKVQEGATKAEQAVTRAGAQARLNSAIETLRGGIFNASVFQQGTSGLLYTPMSVEMNRLANELIDGKIQAEEFIQKLDEIGEKNPTLVEQIKAWQQTAREIAAARGELESYNKESGGIAGGKGDRLRGFGRTANENLSPDLYRRMYPDVLGSQAENITEAIKKGFSDLVGLTEGTDKGRGYNETLGYGAYTGGPIDLVNKTLNEILAIQTRMLADPNNKFNSSAVGRYQIVRSTLKDLMKQLGLSGDEFFDPAMQDRLFNELVRQSKGDPKTLRGRWPSLDARGISDAQIAAALDKTITNIPPLDPEVQKRIDALKSLKLDAAVAQLDEFQQKMVATAQAAGATDEELKQIVSALASGDLDKIPDRFKEFQQALQSGFDAQFVRQLEALKTDNIISTMSELDQETIQTARSFGIAESEIRAFIAAAQTGDAIPPKIAAIRAEMEKLQAINLEKDIWKGVFSDLRSALDDGKISLEEWGDIAMNVLDKVIDKIEDQLVNSIVQLGMASGGGGGGGGFLSSLFGGLFGGGGSSLFPPAPGLGLFDSGGAITSAGMVSFGPKTRKLSFGALQADSGLGPKNFLSVLEQGESVLTEDHMSRTMDVLDAAAKMPVGKGGGQFGVKLYLPEGWQAKIVDKAREGARKDTLQIVSGYDDKLPRRVHQINSDPRVR